MSDAVFARSFSRFFVTDFFHTKVYLPAIASIFVPSIKISFPESSPISLRKLLDDAMRISAHSEKCSEMNRDIVVWSGEGIPSSRYMKFISLLQAFSISLEE